MVIFFVKYEYIKYISMNIIYRYIYILSILILYNNNNKQNLYINNKRIYIY